MHVTAVDYDYLNTYKMEMADGRFFSKEFPSDLKGVILNQEAIRAMNLESSLGKRFSFYWSREARIIGVIKNFHYKPLSRAIDPLIIRLADEDHNYLTIRIAPVHDKFPDLIEFMEKEWRKFRPEYPFEFHFLDETIERQYAAEQRFNKIFQYFASVAIFIACLGLFGLAALSAEQRTKEISIRKVLGASVTGIVLSFCREFTQWILLANLIAWPLAWYFMNKWLESFAYRTILSWWMFVLAGGITLVIALLTVSYQSVKAALANPAESLRYE